MVYLPNIPQPDDDLDDSQGDILGNFQQLDTSFGINHYQFSDATTSNGMHKKVDFPAVTTVAAPSGAASVIYPKSVAGVASPYFRNSVGDTTMWRGGSTNGLVSITTGGYKSQGQIVFPNGIIFRWGYVAGAVNDQRVNFPDGNFPNAIFSVNISSSVPANPVLVSIRDDFNVQGFNVRTSTTTDICYWAIGN